MKLRVELGVGVKKSALWALAALALVATVLAVLAFSPPPERLPSDRAPLATPVVLDEPVVHRYK